MPIFRAPPKLLWTKHARDKMGYYRLSEARVRRVMNAPQRVEEGVAPKTVAMMQPASIHAAQAKPVAQGNSYRRFGIGRNASIVSADRTQKMNRAMRLRPSLRFGSIAPLRGGPSRASWSQEIWVMVQDVPGGRKVISAWRYPGVSKVRGEMQRIMKNEYDAYISKRPL